MELRELLTIKIERSDDGTLYVTVEDQGKIEGPIPVEAREANVCADHCTMILRTALGLDPETKGAYRLRGSDKTKSRILHTIKALREVFRMSLGDTKRLYDHYLHTVDGYVMEHVNLSELDLATLREAGIEVNKVTT